jgi:hypothetical protein
MRLKSFSEFVNESFKGGAMQTYNNCVGADTVDDAKNVLKSKGIDWDEELVSYNGIIEFRKNSDKFSSGTIAVAMYNPTDKTLYIEGSIQKSFEGSMYETVGTINAPVYDEFPEEFPEIQVEKDEKYYKYLKEIATILRELFHTAIDNEYDGNRVKEAMFPKYKGTKTKIHVTEDGNIRFDSFGRYPDITVNLKNMKKGKHTKETIKEEIKSNLKKLEERMPGMPTQSSISSFQS